MLKFEDKNDATTKWNSSSINNLLRPYFKQMWNAFVNSLQTLVVK